MSRKTLIGAAALLAVSALGALAFAEDFGALEGPRPGRHAEARDAGPHRGVALAELRQRHGDDGEHESRLAQDDDDDDDEGTDAQAARPVQPSAPGAPLPNHGLFNGQARPSAQVQ